MVSKAKIFKGKYEPLTWGWWEGGGRGFQIKKTSVKGYPWIFSGTHFSF